MFGRKIIGILTHPGFNDLGKSSSPPAPDYAGAAQATAAGNADAARIASKANRVSQFTPYGNIVYTQGGGDPVFNESAYNTAYNKYTNDLNQWQNKQSQKNLHRWAGQDGGTLFGLGGNGVNVGPKPIAPNKTDYYTSGDPDRWSATVTLSPEQQLLLDQQNKISLGLGNTMDRGLGYVQNMLDSPLDTSGFTKVDPASVAGREAVTAALLDRMQPGLDRQRQQRENALLIQGHNRGGEAWSATQDDLARAENDARLSAIMAGGQEQSRLGSLQQAQRQNQLAEAQTLRNEPINTLNAVRSGAQVTNPQFSNVPQQATTAGPNYMQAAQNQYSAALDGTNASNMAASNTMNGLFSLGAAALPLMFSDRRLKSNIKRIGTHRSGIGIYEYDIFGRRDVGVMADEVLAVNPGAVVEHPSGFLMVNYGML